VAARADGRPVRRFSAHGAVLGSSGFKSRSTTASASAWLSASGCAAMALAIVLLHALILGVAAAGGHSYIKLRARVGRSWGI
jgi:hypothetical protein